MKTNEIYQSVTDTIIDLLQSHQKEWNRPWISFGQDNDYARNITTGKYYRGVNQFLLSFMLMRKGFFKNTWLTFKQTQSLGGHVKKGESLRPSFFTRLHISIRTKNTYQAIKWMVWQRRSKGRPELSQSLF